MRETEEISATLEKINQFPLNPDGYTVDTEVFASPSNWGQETYYGTREEWQSQMIAPGSMWRTWYEEKVEEDAEFAEEYGFEVTTWNDYMRDSLDELIPVAIVDE